MSDQTALWDQPPYEPRSTDPETSREFADRMNATYPDQWSSIVADMRVHGPSTYREVAERTGIDGTSTSTAMTKMEKRGILRRLLDADGNLAKRNGAMLRSLTGTGMEAKL